MGKKKRHSRRHDDEGDEPENEGDDDYHHHHRHSRESGSQYDGTARVLRLLVRGNAPLSPFTDVPWTLIIAAGLWLVATLTSRSAFADVVPSTDAIPTRFSVAWEWFLFALAAAFYAYKYAENLTLLLAPETWWAFRYIDYRTLRREVRQSDTDSPVSFTDATSLFFAYPFVFGLLLYATQESWPGSFLAAPLWLAGAVRHVRFFALAVFLQHGVGFSSIVSLQFSGDVASVIVSLFGAFISLSLFGSIIGVVLGRRSFAERLGLTRI